MGLLLVLHAAAISLFWFTPHVAGSIANSAVRPEQGLAYQAAISSPRKPSIYLLPSDTHHFPDNSDLVLLENGRPLGPSHAGHVEIRERGGGRYSHWNGSIIFSASDDSDPRVNGNAYSIESSTVVKPALRIVAATLLLLLDTFFFLALRNDILLFLRNKASILLSTLALSIICAAALSAFGAFGTLIVAKGSIPGDTALSVRALQHACLGCLISAGMWAAGAGLTRLLGRSAHAGPAQVLISAFPVGLIWIAVLAAISLVVPQGRMIAFALWIVSLLPLLSWRPPRQELSAAIGALLLVVPLAIAFGIWLGILWHGPTQTLSGSPSGDLSYYAGSIWAIAEHPYPFIDLGYENSSAHGYFNQLFPALGATLLYLPGFDPFLFLLAGGGASYILLSAMMLHFYLRDRAPYTGDFFRIIVLVLSFVVAARYPYWVIESLPTVFVPALTIAVLWMVERGQRAVGWTIAAMLAGLTGSMLSKVTTAAVLVPLGATGLWQQFWLLPYSIRAVALAIGCLSSVYCAALLWHYLPMFISIGNLGPESFRSPQWWFVCRDIGALVLAVLAWLLADVAAALALTIGLLTFLLYSFVFQINFVCVTILLGLMTFARPEKLATAGPIALAGMTLALPAALFSDPAGSSTGVIWVVCLGGATLAAVMSAVQIRGLGPALTLRTSAAMGWMTLAITGLGLVGVARGHIIANSGWNRTGPQLTPELADIWSAVRKLTPHDALLVTDQVDETMNILGGWNTYAWLGQRQIYLSSYYTSFELRTDPAKLREILAINESVLNGIRSPAEIPTRSRYEKVYGVVAVSRVVPSSWKNIYSNKDYAIFRISP